MLHWNIKNKNTSSCSIDNESIVKIFKRVTFHKGNYDCYTIHQNPFYFTKSRNAKIASTDSEYNPKLSGIYLRPSSSVYIYNFDFTRDGYSQLNKFLTFPGQLVSLPSKTLNCFTYLTVVKVFILLYTNKT